MCEEYPNLVGEEARVAEVLERDRDAEREHEEETREEEDVSDVMRGVAAAAHLDTAQILTVLSTRESRDTP